MTLEDELSRVIENLQYTLEYVTDAAERERKRAQLESKRADHAESIMQTMSDEINELKSGERDDPIKSITPGQRAMGYHEIFPYGVETWANGEE